MNKLYLHCISLQINQYAASLTRTNCECLYVTCLRFTNASPVTHTHTHTHTHQHQVTCFRRNSFKFSYPDFYSCVEHP
jgi:hypothetical protein